MNRRRTHKSTSFFFTRVYVFFVIWVAFSANGVNAQNIIHGTIVNANTKENIPFVHIVIESSQKSGTVSNIEGQYKLLLPSDVSDSDSIHFSCIGFAAFRESVAKIKNNPVVFLHPESSKLAEVIIRAHDDPAYAMMQKVIENRDKNNPESLPHFKFTSYNKANIDVSRTDSVQAQLAKTGFKNAHLLMLESATEVIYKNPGKWSETVIAGKMSGIKNPALSLVSNSFQPFSCYSDYLNISGFDYLNPISPNSRARYYFTLRDSAQVAGQKVYIIQFTPRKNAAEELMKGTLSISANTYALVNFHAQNRDDHKLMQFEIRQAYEQIDSLWFPKESNTTYTLPNEDVNSDIIASSTTYIRNVDLEYMPQKGDFGIAAIQHNSNAGTTPDSTWQKLRNNPLSTEEENTYAVYDTLPVPLLNTLNWFANQTTSLINGRMNFGNVDFLLPHLLRFNPYEGLRLGGGFATSQKLIKWMSAEGYAAYGFKDRAWKYGGGLQFFIYPKKELELKLYYQNDLKEPGRERFAKDVGFLNAGEIVRNLFAREMEEVERYHAQITWRPVRSLRLQPFVSYEKLSSNFSVLNDVDISLPPTISAMYGMELRYTPGEKLMQVGRVIAPVNLTYPRFRLLIAHNTPEVLESNTSFAKAQFEFEHEFKIRGAGTTRIYGNAAKIWGDNVPYPYLLFGRGVAGQKDIGVMAPGYFQTMDLYRFLSDQYIQGGIVHNFGSVFGIKKSFSKPELKIAYSAAIGNISENNSENVVFKFQELTKPYLEGGIMIDNILRMSSSFYYSGYGVGVFYNHGAYEEPQFIKNLSFILTAAISL